MHSVISNWNRNRPKKNKTIRNYGDLNRQQSMSNTPLCFYLQIKTSREENAMSSGCALSVWILLYTTIQIVFTFQRAKSLNMHFSEQILTFFGSQKLTGSEIFPSKILYQSKIPSACMMSHNTFFSTVVFK